MKKILGIIGSPRRLGNSEIVIKEISANLTEPHELKLIRQGIGMKAMTINQKEGTKAAGQRYMPILRPMLIVVLP